ncbi:universal stress protein, partial [bacterium]|nr:universal stress protein [bacterium]
MRVPIDKIMCGIDFSDYSDFALSYGAALATELKARLYVCHIIDVTSAVIYGE